MAGVATTIAAPSKAAQTQPSTSLFITLILQQGIDVGCWPPPPPRAKITTATNAG
jgi:hypothetical protein